MTEKRSVPRRDVLKATVAATLGLSSGFPTILGAQDKAAATLPRVGEGEFVYECIHDWGAEALPAGHHYGNASHGVAVDKQGLIYVTHYGGPGSLFVFAPDGRFIRAMGDDLTVAGKPKEARSGRGHGIDIREEAGTEYLYLSPSESSLPFCKMTLDGKVVWKRGREELNRDSGAYDDPKAAYRPTNTSFRPDGGYYLGDGYGSSIVFEYDKNDRFVRVIGGRGKEDGKFNTPHGHWLDDRDGTPKLVVADRANERLQWFDMDGKHVKTQGGFLFPAAIDSQGDLLLVPDLHARVTILGKDNQPVAQLGDDPTWRASVLDKETGMRGKRALWQPGRFVHPHDACFDRDGNIFVAEWVVTGRLTKLVKVG